MAKKRGKKQAALTYPGAPVETHKKWRMVALLAALLLVGLIVAGYVLHPVQPRLIVWLLGLACAAAAVAVYVLATHEPEHDDLVLRIQRGQHLDFGKRLRDTRKQRRQVNLPVVGQTSVRSVVGAGIFLFVFVWWLTPLAPVRVREKKIEDLSVPLGGEITAVVLVLPDPYLATAQPPIVPARAAKLAKDIPDKAGAYQRGQKAIAQRRFEDALQLLSSALEAGGGDPADIHVALGQANLYAFRFGEAVREYKKARETRRDDPGLLCQAAVAAIHASDYGEAETLTTRAVTLADKPEKSRSSTDNVTLAAALHLRAVLLTIHGATPQEFDEAERLYARAKDIQRNEAAIGEDHPYVAVTVNNQAVLYQLRAMYPGIQALHNQARQTWTKSLGKNHPHVAASLGNLAMFYCTQGRYDDAQDANQQAVAIRREAFPADPPESPAVGAGLVQTSTLERALAHYDAARVPAEQALAIFEKTLDPNHPNIAASANAIASAYLELAHFSALAQPYYERAAAVTGKSLGAEHPYMAVTLSKLANLTLTEEQHPPVKGKQYPHARKDLQRALEITKKAYGEQPHPVTAMVLNALGRLEIAEARPYQARSHLEKALKIEDRLVNEEDQEAHKPLEVAVTLGYLAALHKSPETGREAYRRAIEAAKQALGQADDEHPFVAHPFVARLEYNLAGLLAQQKLYDEAEQHLKQAKAIQENVFSSSQPNHPDLADTLDAYADLLEQAHPARAAEAEKMRTQAKNIRQAHAEQDRRKNPVP